MPDPAIGQREAINKAIDAADTAVAAVNNDAGSDVVTTADERIAAARAAIDAAAHVPDPEKTAFTGNVNALASRLRTAKTARTDAMTAAQQAADKAVMEKAGKLHKGIQEYDKSGITFRGQNLTDNNNAGRIGAGFSGRNVHVWIRRAIPNPVVLKGDKKAVVAPLHGAQGWRATAAPDGGGTYEATAYRASSEPRQGDKFSMQYSANFSNGVLNTATTEAAANRVASPSFDQSAAWKRFELPDNTVAVMIPGTYHGVAGTYSCVPGTGNTCAARVADEGFDLGGVTAANAFNKDNAEWTFKPTNPDARVMGRAATRIYDYGWWLHKSEDNGTWYAGSFFDGDSFSLPTSTKGTATYRGGAAGVYALSSTTGGTNDAGHFTARARLEADFTDGSITGTIDNFMVGALGNPTNEARDWSVELKKLGLLTDDNRIGQPASSTLGVQVDDTTVWTIDGSPADVSGNWHGGFMRTDNRDPSSGVPDGVAGRFYTEYGNNGKMTGGFGASCTTCPKEN